MPYIFIKSIAMAVGDINAEEDFGLANGGFTMNWIIFFFFLILVCLVIWNLFVGIAVSDIGAVLSESDVRFLSFRIVYCLKIQAVSEPILKK